MATTPTLPTPTILPAAPIDPTPPKIDRRRFSIWDVANLYQTMGTQLHWAADAYTHEETRMQRLQVVLLRVIRSDPRWYLMKESRAAASPIKGDRVVLFEAGVVRWCWTILTNPGEASWKVEVTSIGTLPDPEHGEEYQPLVDPQTLKIAEGI